MASSSSSSSSTIIVTREEFNAFHKIDRTLFTRLVLTLKRDITQSIHIMSFLLYLEKIALFMSNLILSLVSLPDYFVNVVADEVVMCLSCLSFEDYATFLANSMQNNNSFAIPFITQMTRGQITLPIIHQNRKNILLQVNKHLKHTCYPAFEDICLQMYNKEKMFNEEKEKTMEKMSQMRINIVQNLSDQQEKTNQVSGASEVISAKFSKDEQVLADDRTIFLTFSRGYPVSEAEVRSYFTRRFGDIIEAVHMPEVEVSGQAMYAKMVLRSAAKIQDIVSDEEGKNKFIINGKHVKVRKYIHRPSGGNNM